MHADTILLSGHDTLLNASPTGLCFPRSVGSVEPLTKTDCDRLLRWRVLREPWNHPRGTERDDFDVQSFSLTLPGPSGGVVAAGRLHLNCPDKARIRPHGGWQESERPMAWAAASLEALERHPKAENGGYLNS
jgi:hypothetical protein